ncbi:MAG: polyphosphate polymerase domain-containing protein [Myxococcota bacterium]|nr:polyphosphate polymerase domain-containing protein [Myxococcota bacterium]
MKVVRRFNRYELKYLLHVSRLGALVSDLVQFMSPDDHGDADGCYRVSSLYYDSPDLYFYRSKIEGLRFRRKLRVRVYPDGPGVGRSATAFVEIKQRMNRTIQKRRVVLPLGKALALCAGTLDEWPPLDDADVTTASEITYLLRALQLRPTCIVSYRRRAFVGSRYEQGMRLTFDSLLEGRTTVLDLCVEGPRHLFLPPDWVVMEIKVNDRVPNWVTSLVAKHECELTRISKYCAAVARSRARLQLAWAAKEEACHA